MAEELMVVLSRSDTTGLGFSILGTSGLPPIIYDIVENSPAAESGEVEAGDVILKVNETDVNCFSTKEVLKCLRLSADPITLKLKRDPVIKARIQGYLERHGLHDDPTEQPACRDLFAPPPPCSTTCSYDACTELEALLPPAAVDRFEEEDRWEPLSVEAEDRFARPRPAPRFEAFMMTGELILNLSRAQQGTGLLPRQSKKVDSLRHNHHHHHHNHHHRGGGGGGGGRPQHNSVPTSPNESAQRSNSAIG